MKLIIVISGFTQKKHEQTGSRALWLKLRMERNILAQHNVMVRLKEWDSDWKEYAEWINSLNPESVLICCYSWGGGFGMPELSKRLQCDVSVVACDPVYRSKTPLGRWMAFTGNKIKLDSHVSIIGWVSQKSPWYKLDGHKFTGGNEICEEIKLNYTHTEIDDSVEYHELAVLKAEEYLLK